MLRKVLKFRNWALFAGFVTIFVSVIVCSFDFAISYPPVPSSGAIAEHDQSSASTEQRVAAADQRGTKDVPFAVEVVPPKEGTPESKRYEKDRLEKSSNERGLTIATWILAFATIVLFIFAGIQVGLFYWQLRLIRESLAPAKEAAVAAREAAEHIPRVERAYLFVKVKAENFGVVLNEYTKVTDDNLKERISTIVIVDFSVENLGKTPATIRQVSASLRHLTALPKEPDYSTIILLPKNRFLGAGTESDPPIKVNEPIRSYEAIRQLVVEESFIWFYGRILYDDIFGKEHEHRFVWRFSGGFFLPNYENQNYTKNT